MKTIIENTIIQIENQVNKDDAYFEFYQDIEGHITANKEGLQLCAVEFLKASLLDMVKKEELFYNLNIDIYGGLANENKTYIELIDKRRNEILMPEKRESKETFKDKLSKYGCFFTLLLLIGIFIVGIGTVISWL